MIEGLLLGYFASLATIVGAIEFLFWRFKRNADNYNDRLSASLGATPMIGEDH